MSKMTKVKNDSRKLTRKLNEDKRLMKSMDAFTVDSMHEDPYNALRGTDLMDIYTSTTRFDQEW